MSTNFKNWLGPTQTELLLFFTLQRFGPSPSPNFKSRLMCWFLADVRILGWYLDVLHLFLIFIWSIISILNCLLFRSTWAGRYSWLGQRPRPQISGIYRFYLYIRRLYPNLRPGTYLTKWKNIHQKKMFSCWELFN